jgi:hypothetical protein
LDVEAFFEDTLEAVDDLEAQFREMMNRKFDDDLVKEYIESVFQMPVEPRRAKIDQRIRNQYLSRVEKVKDARMKIAQLRLYGKGSDLPGVSESLWGTFNAVLEYVDHHGKDGDISISSGLFGSAAALKRKAFNLALQYLS